MPTTNPDLSSQAANEPPPKEVQEVKPMQFFGNVGGARGVTADFRPQVEKLAPAEDAEPVSLGDEPGLDPAQPEVDPEDVPQTESNVEGDDDEDDDSGGFEELLEGDESDKERTVADDPTGDG